MEKLRLFKVFTSDTCGEEVAKVLSSGYIGQGPKVDEFEQKLQQHFNTDKQVITVDSCTTALELSYELIGLQTGDTVISTAMTCAATNLPLYNKGVNIVWADVDPVTGLIDPEDVGRKMTPEVKAIVCVDWCGNPCDYDALRKFNVPIVEDAAHALNTTYNGKHVADTGGDYVCWSFQAIKHLTCGDGGALVVPKDQERRAVNMRWFGFDRTLSASFRCSQDITEKGFKFHMNDISATIGLENIRHSNTIVKRHIDIARRYSNEIKNEGVALIPFDDRSSYWIFTVLVDDKDSFIEYLTTHNIETSPVHNRNDNYSIFKSSKSILPNLDSFYGKQLAIPVGWWLSDDEVDYIIDVINKW